MKTEAINETYVVGRYYRVPCVYAHIWKRLVPIHGPLHEDKEHIGFADDHWHLDWRFVAAPLLARLSDKGRRAAHAVVISQKNTAGETVERRMKCKRKMPEFPRISPWGNPVSWLEGLETAYADARLKCGSVCPHRGLPLAGCPVNDGIVVCPGHGLAWNVETGALAKRVNR